MKKELIMEYNKKFDKDIDTEKLDSEFILASLKALLKELIRGVPGVRAAAIVSIEGLPVVSALPENITEDVVAETTSMLLSLAERAINAMNVGDLEQLNIQGSISNLTVLTAGEKNVLTVLTEKSANLGYVYIACEKICEKIARVFK